MAELQWRVGLYRRLLGARIRSQLQYRVSFVLDMVSAFFLAFTDFLAVLILFTHLPRLAGWSLPEVAFFYGAANLAFSLCDLVIGHLDLFPAMIRTGSFDLLLVRPAGSLFQVLTSDLSLRRLGRIGQSLVVLGYALAHLHTIWTPGRVAMLPVMIVAGAVIYAGVWIAAVSIAFWTVEVREISNAFTYGGSFLASYPLNIFAGWLRGFMAFAVPLAFVSYFPGVYVLGHPDPLRVPTVLQYCAPLVALLVAVVAGRVWTVGVRHYRSTGS